MERKINISEILLELSVPLLVIIGFVLAQFPPGSSILRLGWDAGYPLNLGVWFKNSLNVWNSTDSLGANRSLFIATWPVHAIEDLFSQLGLSIFDTQKLILIFWFYAMSVSYYIFVFSFYPQRKYRWLRIFASVFYILNFYMVTRFRAYERTAFTLMINLPITITIVIKYLQGRISLIKSLILLGILSFFFNGAGIPPYWGLLWTIIILTSLFHLLLNRFSLTIFKKILVFIPLFFIIFIWVNAYWVGPFISYNIEAYFKITVERGFEDIVVWLREASKTSSLLNVLQMKGTDLWEGTENISSARFYSMNPFGIILSILTPLITFLSLLFAKKGRDRNFVIFFSILAVIFIFLSAGFHPPLGNYFLWIFTHIPLFAVYRTPIYKFPYIIVISYAFLFGFSMYTLINILQEKVESIKIRIIKKITNILGISFLILYLAYNFILYTDKEIFKLNPLFTLRVSVPNYILQAGDYLNNKKEDSRVLLLPMQADNFGGVDAYKWGYSSLTPLTMLMLNKGTIGRTNVAYASEMIRHLYTSVNNSDWQDVYKYTMLFNIKYLLLRKDIYYNAPNIVTDNPEKIEKNLSDGEIQLDQEFGKWKLYSVPDTYFTPHIYIPRKLIFINGDSYDFANILSLMPSENYSAYYFSSINTTSFTPQVPFDSFILLPGNLCCTTFYKTGITGSKEYKSLIDEKGIMTVFLNERFFFKVPKDNRFKIYLRTDRPFTNAQKITIGIDNNEIKKEVASDERKTDWILAGDIELKEGNHKLSIFSDGKPINAIKTGDIVLASLPLTPKSYPSIEFQKISNTKFKVSIKEAKEPFILVFSESFDPEWKLYINKKQNQPGSEIITSYLYGQIKERKHTNDVFHKNMFETLYTKSLSESRHFMLNGFANAWYILPEDAQGRQDYEMIIEYYPQRLFNVGIVISFTGVFLFVIALSYLTFKKYRVIVH